MTRPLLHIDLDGIIRHRLGPRRARLLPRAATRLLENLVCQNRLNQLLSAAWPAEGSAFSEALLRELGISLEVEGAQRIPPGKRLIFASNHPLGGLDGISLIKVLGEMYGDENVRFLVNDLLMNVAPLADVFLPVNKFGAQGREAAKAINTVYESQKQVAIFPAGLVSRLGDDGLVADLKWQKAFAAKAIEHHRDIVPVRFVALNRSRFYRLARTRTRLGVKVNLEQALLPSELCAAGGSSFRVIFGEPISWESLAASGKAPALIAAEVRARVYSLFPPEKLR